MPREVSIIVGDGSVTALAGGPVSIADLGDRKTRRASHLEFNPTKNKWEVWDFAKTTVLHEEDDYDVALAWEIEHFNRLLSVVG